MSDINKLMNKGRRACAAMLGLAAISMLLARQNTFLQALLIGMAIGYLNFEVLYRRVVKITPDGMANPPKLMITGSGLRFSSAIFGALLVQKLGMTVSGYVVGLVIPLIIFTMLFALQDVWKRKG